MAAAEAGKDQPRIVAVRGLNDIHDKHVSLPKPVMGMLQGLQYAVPTFAFHTWMRGYSQAIAEAATPTAVTPARTWQLMAAYGRSGGLPIMGSIATFFAVRGMVDDASSAKGFFLPLAVTGLPAAGLAIAARAAPPEPVLAGLVWAATWHFWTQHLTPYKDNGYKGFNLSRF